MKKIRPRHRAVFDKLLSSLLVAAFLVPPQLSGADPLRIQLIPGTNHIEVRLSNTSQTNDYQVLRKTNLNSPQWSVEREVPGLDVQTSTYLSTNRPPTVFYTAREVLGVTNAGLTLRLGTSNVSYALGSPPLLLDRTVLVQNAAHPNFDAGQLTLSFSANGDPDDLLEIQSQGTGAGQIGLSGNTVTWGGAAIGTVVGGSNLSPFQVLFNANATATNITSLLRQLTFQNRSLRYSRLPRTLRYDLTDGQGARAIPAFKVIDVACPDGIDAMVVIDVSFSLSDQAFLQMKQTATNLIGYLDPVHDRVGLATIYGGSTLVDRLTNNFAKVRQDLLALQHQSGTILHPAISNAQSALLAAPRTNVLRLMLILTDGEMSPRSTESNAVAAAALAKAADIRIVAAGFVNASGRVFNDFLQQVASSPADYYAPDTSSNAPPIEVQLAAQLRAAARSFCRLPNTAPTAIAQSITTPEDTPRAFTLQGSDPDGDTLAFTILNGPAHGTLTGTPPNLVYNPQLNYVGPDTIVFKAVDGLLESAPAIVTVTVTAANDRPIALDQSLTNHTRTPVGITLEGFDADGDTLTFTVVTQPTNGVLNVSSGLLTGRSNHVVYTPAINASGPDEFRFVVHDGQTNSAPGLVRVFTEATCPLLAPADWMVRASTVGARPGAQAGTVTWSGCQMTLAEGDSFVVAAERFLPVPALGDSTGRLLLDITYQGPAFDHQATNRMRDVFEAALVDGTGRSLAFTIQGAEGVVPAGTLVPPVLPAVPDVFFNHSDDLAPFAAPLAALLSGGGDLRTVTVEITGLAPSLGAKLVLRLVNNDEDRTSTVRVVDLQLREVAPGPGSPGSTPPALSLILGPGGAAGIGSLTPDDACRISFSELAARSGSNVVVGISNGPTVAILEPGSNAALPIGFTLISGQAVAQAIPSGPALPNRILAVQLNGRPVDAVDAAGNFFAIVELHSGTNRFDFVAFDAGDRRTTNSLVLLGTQCATNFAGLGVVSSAQPAYGRTTFNDWTRTLYADVALRNDAGYHIRAPLFVGVTAISDPSVRVLAADGISADGIPYYDFSSAVPTASGTRTLASGQTSAARILAFHNPNLTQFTYQLVVLAQLNQSPSFTTVPAIEAMISRPYTYAARAEDSDGDSVVYTMVEGPVGAIIDVNSGLVTWLTPGPLGNHAFKLEADDGRGGLATQNFTVNVTTAASNRPPVFVSTPVVAAYLGTNYQYNAVATDPDLDALTYSVVLGPTNLSVNPSSGVVTWTPVADQLGTNAVALRAADERGGVALQSFIIVVLPDSNNRPPVIVSQPAVSFEFPLLGMGSQGLVTPALLDLFLSDGESFSGTAAITLPATNVLAGTADIAFVVDQSASMAGEQAWIGEMLQGLDKALVARGIGPNRYALIGFPGNTGPDYTQTFPILGGSWTASLYGPDNILVGSRRFDGVSNPAELVLPNDGTYHLVVFGDGNTQAVSYGLSYRALTNTAVPVTVGDTITGTISVPGQTATYTFNLGQRTVVTFDSLTASSTLTWTLTGPGGVVVNARRFDLSDSTDQNVPVLDLPAGAYVLTVDGTGTAVGAYAFRLLNLSQATALVAGTPMNGELNPANETDLYRFTAGSGQRVYVDMRSLSGPATSSRWRLVGPAGQVLAVQTLGVDMETGPLVAGGVQTLMVEGRVTETNSRNYTLNVEVLGAAGEQAIVAGQSVNGSIGVAGERQAYQFEVLQRSLWYFDVLSSNNANNLTWTLEGPAGTNVNSRRFDQSDAGDITNPVLDLVAGTYRLTVDGTADVTGPYAFRLLNLDNGQGVGAGSVVSGELNPANETEVYEFTAALGERMIFDALTKTNLANARWRLIGPSGGVFFNTFLGTDVGAVTMTQAGEYRLLVEGSRLDVVAGTYEFRLLGTNSVAVPPLTGSPLTLGSRVDGELATTNEVGEYVFSLAERSLLYLDALTNRSAVVWTLRGPYGTNVAARRFDQTDSADQAAVVLDLVAGNYQLVVDATGTNVGGYAFAMLDLAQATELTPGLAVSGQLEPGQETVMYEFTASKGQRVYVDMQSLSGGTTTSRWRLIDPLGQQVFNQVLGTDVETGGLAMSGSYTLLLEARITETNSRNYTLNVELLTDSVQPLTVGETVQGTIRVTGEQDVYGFNLAERTLLYFDSLTPSNTLTWTLEGPAGVVVNARRFDQSDSVDNSSPVLDLVAGNYRLSIDAGGAVTGDYGFRLINLAAATPLVSAVTVSGSITPPQETDLYQFTVPAGARLYLDELGLTGGATSSRWRIINPLGQVVGDQRLDLDLEILPLNLSGTYTLLVEGRVFETVARNYDLAVIVLPKQESPLNIGDAITGTISVPGQTATYTFNLGQRTVVTFDSLTASSTLTWTLTGPGGVVVNARRFDLSDSTDQNIPVLDLPAGAYVLTVDGTGTAVGAYAFRLLNLSQATALVAGTPMNGELNPANETDLYRFTAGSGQRVYVDMRSLSGPATSSRWRLVGPAGQVLAVQTLGVDMETGPLVAGGVQTLMVEGRVTETNSRNYTLNVEVLGAAGEQAIVAGQSVNGSIGVAGERQAYQFEVLQRSLWYFDVLSSNNANNLTWTLEGPAGTNVNSRRFDQSDAGDITNPVLDLVAGTYRLTVDGTADVTGPYAFRLLNLDNGQGVGAGSVVSGELNPANETEVYEFTAALGERMIFDALTKTNLANARWRLIGPSGGVFFNTFLGTDVGAVTMTQAGEYRLLVEGSRLDVVAGTYEFRLLGTNSVAVPPLTGSPLTLGSRVDGELATTNEVGEYVFSLAERSLLYLDALTNRSAVVWTLRGPYGTNVAARRFDQTDSADQAAVVLDLVAGNYQLVVDATGTNVGGYAFAMLDLAQATELTPGLAVSGQLEPGQETVMYEFTASKGQRVYVDMQSLSGGTTTSRWRLIDPLGQQVFNQVLGTDVETGGLAMSGSYTLLLEARITETNSRNYTLNVELLTDSVQPLTVGETVQGSIRVTGEQDVYGFNLAERTLLYFDSLTPSNTLTWTLEGPAGVVVNARLFSFTDTGSPLFTLDLVPGNYRLTVDAIGDARLPYAFRLQPFGPLSPGANPMLLSGFLATGQQVDVFEINGVAGEKLYLDFDTQGGSLFGPASLFVGTSRLLTTTAGGTEDGYAGITAALRQLPFRSSAALNVILVTDENRDIVDTTLSLAGVITEARTNNVRMNVVLDGLVQNSAGSPAIGLDASLKAYTADGAGGFVASTNGTFIGPAVNDDAPENPLAEYVPLAWQTGGATWDLNQLRLGGLTAESFTKAFVEVNAESIELQLLLELIASDASVVFTNLTGILDGIGSGDTATFSFRLVRTGDARGFALQFVRPGTTDVLASIPVRFRNEYVYQVDGFDPDGDRLRFTLVQGPQGATLDPNSGALRWRPQTNETSQFVVRVEDGRGGVGFQEFSVGVSGTNRAPQIGPVAYPVAAVDRVYTFPLDVSDPDGDRLAFDLVQSPPGMSIDGASGVIRWRPAANQLGHHTAVARVKDGRGGVAERSWDIEVVSTVLNANPEFVSSPLTLARVGRQYYYRARVADPNADELTFDLPLGPSGLSVSSNGLVLWVPGLTQVGSHDVVLRVRDNFGGVALQSFAIQVSAGNIAPVITSIPKQRAVTGVPYQYEVQAQDADNQPLVFALGNSPPAGLTLVPHPFLTNAAVLSWTPGASQAGVHRIGLTVRDPDGAEAFQSFELTVTPTGPNSTPAFVTRPRTKTRIGLPYVYQAEATDEDADPLSFALVRGPAGMVLTNSNTGTLRSRLVRWTPATLGAFPVAISVNDGRAGGVVTQEFVLNVVSTLENNPPSIVSTPVTQSTVRELYLYNLSAVDPDGDVITWRLVAGPTGMSLDPVLGTLRWTPGLEQLGSQVIIVEAEDLFQATDRQSFTITVELANRPPNITSTPPTVAQTGEPLLYAARGVDPDGDTLRWNLVSGEFPAGMIIDGVSGLVRWTPTPGQIGNHAVAIAVTDGRGGSSTQRFNLFASDLRANRAPVISSSPLRDATIARPYAYVFRATDPDGDTLTLQAASALPAGATFVTSGPGMAVLSWTPVVGQAGRHEFSLLARDPAGVTASQRFFVTVRSNALPVIVSTPLTNAVPTLPYRYDVRALDADGDSLSYTLLEAPAGMDVDGFGRVTWVPSLAQSGNNRVTVTVSDGFGGSATQTFFVTVAPDTQPPMVRLDIGYNLADSTGNLYVRAGSEVTLRVEATDDVAVTARELIVAGTARPLTADGSAVVTFPQTGMIEAVARAMDSSGNFAAITNYVPVVDPSATSTVAIVIISPTNSAEITRVVPVVATITSEVPLSSYRLEVAALDGDMPSDGLQISDPRLAYQSITNAALPPGTLVLTNATLGRFDPSPLQNGGYVLRVSVFDQNGQGRQEGVLVGVAGQLKFGEFRVEFTDLTIPVAGVPIVVKRVYDSREALRSGDFGYGWSLGVQSGRILEVGKRPFIGLGGEGSTFTLRTRVYLTTPDGRRVGFNFTPKFAAASFIFGSFYRPAFTADPGVYETLEPLDASPAYQIRADGSVTTGFGLVGYDPQGYRLITRDNVVYQYDQNFGLQQVTDANSNRVVYARDGVFSVQGGVTNLSQSVRFVRDGQGRIAQIIDPAGQTLNYSYDPRGDLRGFIDQVTNLTQYAYSGARPHYLTNIVDSFGRPALRMEYDAAGRLAAVRDAMGNPVRQDFNADALTGAFTDANGNVTNVKFDERGNEVERSLAGIYTNRFAYDANNNLLRSENGRGFATNYTYDSRGNVTSITDALSNTTAVVYNELNKPVVVTNELGHPLFFQYDGTGQVTNVINALGVSLSLRRDEAGHVIALTDVNGHTFTFGYMGCSCGSPTLVRYPDQSIRQFQYDNLGRRIEETDGSGVTNHSSYDGLGRLAVTRDALTNTTRYEYEGPLLARHIDPLGRITHFEYDAVNRTNGVIDAQGGTTRFEYDNNGNRTKLIDAVTNVTAFVYDAGNRLIQQIDPLGRTNFFNYDAAGNRIEAIDRSGRRRTFGYDGANHLTNETWWQGATAIRSLSFGYNAAGVQTHASDPEGTDDFAYDALNRLRRFARTGVPGQADFILDYTYDNSTNVLSVTDNAGVTTGSVFDNRSRLIRRTWQGPGVDPARADFGYDAAGRRLRIDRYADLAGASRVGFTTQGYNGAGILTNITHRGPLSQILAKYDFNHDAAFQITRLATGSAGNPISDFAYDGTGQLTNVLNAVPPHESFNYDANGTRTRSSNGGGYVVGRGNQILSDGTYNYTYDAEGNVSSRSNIASRVLTTYQLDHRNRLVNVIERNASGVITQTVGFTYDTANRRLSKTVNGVVMRFLYDREDSWADLNGAGSVVARYLHTDRLDELLARQRGSDGRGWYLTDHLGTVRDIADATGVVMAHLDYSSFGQVLSAGNPAAIDRFLFTGREFDGETGWYFYRARYYDPGLGRFASQDPIGFTGHDFNLYRYAANRPTSLTDPLGQASLFEYSVTVGQRVFQFAIHPGHHYWTILGYRIYCIHIQLLTYLIGVSGSAGRIQIPLPWCSGAPF